MLPTRRDAEPCRVLKELSRGSKGRKRVALMARWLSDFCIDQMVDYLFTRCPCAFSEEDGQALFDGLVKIIERDIERVVTDVLARGEEHSETGQSKSSREES